MYVADINFYTDDTRRYFTVTFATDFSAAESTYWRSTCRDGGGVQRQRHMRHRRCSAVGTPVRATAAASMTRRAVTAAVTAASPSAAVAVTTRISRRGRRDNGARSINDSRILENVVSATDISPGGD